MEIVWFLKLFPKYIRDFFKIPDNDGVNGKKSNFKNNKKSITLSVTKSEARISYYSFCNLDFCTKKKVLK